MIAPMFRVSSILENYDKHLWHQEQQGFVVCSYMYTSISFANTLRNNHIAEPYHNIGFSDVKGETVL